MQNSDELLVRITNKFCSEELALNHLVSTKKLSIDQAMVAKYTYKTSMNSDGGGRYRSKIDAAVGLKYIASEEVRKVLHGNIQGFEQLLHQLIHEPKKSNNLWRVEPDFAMQNNLLPLAIIAKTLYYATGSVFTQSVKRKLKFFFPEILYFCPIYCFSFDLRGIIEKTHYSSDSAIPSVLSAIQASTPEKAINSGLIKKLVTILLERCILLNASDIHIEPETSLIRIRYRIDGDLIESYNIPTEFWNSIVTSIKISANIDLIERRLPQDGKIKIQFRDRPINFRLSTHPTIHGENIVLRALDSAKSIKTLVEIGFKQHTLSILQKVLLRPEGVLLMTGPTGSGKTTTLYSILSQLNSPSVNVMTLEDPVEYNIPYVRQSNINAEIGFSFDRGIRSILRQDPDIILMGEIRDDVTAQHTFRAASTGHLVLSTLHTNSAIGSITRLYDLGIMKDNIASQVIAAMAQRLVRTLCDYCKAPDKPTKDEAGILNLQKKDGEYPTIYRRNQKGCDKCGNSGYKGRGMISEIVPITPEIADMIVTGATHTEILNRLHSQGLWRSLLEDGIEMLLDGLVDYESLQGAVDLSHNALSKDLKPEQNNNQSEQTSITVPDYKLVDNVNTSSQSQVESKKIYQDSFAQDKLRINNQQSHSKQPKETSHAKHKIRTRKRKQPVRKT